MAEDKVRERRVPLEGAANFRDLGGYPAADGRTTRWGMLYRSDSLADLTPADLERLDALGIRTLCDFRLPGEAARKPNRLPKNHAIRLAPIGFLPEGTLGMLAGVNDGSHGPGEIEREVLTHYRKFITDHAAEYRRLFELILEDGSLPLLMHCTSGKDRTGIGAAAVLSALGVPRDVIVEDYALTNRYRRDIAHLFDRVVSPEAIHMLTSANPQYLWSAFDAVDAVHGSTEDWLAAMGVDADARARLVHLLTE